MNNNDIMIITGDEIFLTDNYILKLKEKWINNLEELNFIRFDSIKNNIGEIVNYMNTVPFMVEKKILVIDDCDFLTSKKSLSSEDEEGLIKYLNSRNDSNLMVFNCGGIKVDSRKKIYKLISKIGNVVKYDKLKEHELKSWITIYSEKQKRKIAEIDAKYISQIIGYLDYESQQTLYDVKNELDKLISYTKEGTTIKKSDIEMLVNISIENNIFKLVDFISEGKANLAFEILQDMIEKNIAMQYIFYMISRHYRLLVRIYLMEKDGFTQNEIINKMELKSFSYNKMKRQMSLLEYNDVKKVYDMFYDYDKRSKSGLLDMETGIKMIISQAKK